MWYGVSLPHTCANVSVRVCVSIHACVCVSILSSLFPKGTVPFAALMCPLAFLTSLHVPFLFQVTLHTRHSVRSACNACTLSQSVQRKRTVQASLGVPTVPKSWRTVVTVHCTGGSNRRGRCSYMAASGLSWLPTPLSLQIQGLVGTAANSILQFANYRALAPT